MKRKLGWIWSSSFNLVQQVWVQVKVNKSDTNNALTCLQLPSTVRVFIKWAELSSAGSQWQTWVSYNLEELFRVRRSKQSAEYSWSSHCRLYSFIRPVVRSFEAIELMIIGTGLWLMLFFLSLSFSFCDCLLYVAQTQIQSVRFGAAKCKAEHSG